jgi:deazaflavin-dependent oxidoreductase (nitroreductase family)
MWFFNLLANPVVMIERGSETYRALADVLSGQSRSRAFEKMIAALPRFKDYQDQVARAIPVIRLSRCEQ